MPDLSSAAYDAIRAGSLWALPLLFAAGVLSSIGPCAAPRILTLSALILRSRQPLAITAAFLLGTLGVYATFGLAAGTILGSLTGLSSYLYGAVAVAGIAGAVVTLASARSHVCEPEPSVQNDGSIGMAFLAGAGFSLMISPCCTPILAVVLAVSAFTQTPFMIAGMLVVFGLGHASAVLVACHAGRPVLMWLPRSRFAQGAQIVAGSLMLALGAYYALLA